ncbi:MAG: agmatinase [Armatimonadota bacterium]|nr:agmatinase [Armatimonadota bacterium]MDR7402449.1 agmatinase [Armatimonadota bacterium]MDR7403772.1 agmatinase [Armatimonadota bacterium]MDR7437899.1 agmatinase [Armatimonadota bacterium]MDR7472124.1 agmatinase [Armatimonadota bacterium]
MTFLASRPHPAPAAVIVGVPYDATASFRAGARAGPAAIRWASQSIETYSPILDADLEQVAVADAGDVEVDGLEPPRMVEVVAGHIRSLDPAVLPVILGGEHTITLGVVSALVRRHPDLAVVQVDAHTDLRDTYEGQRVGHATVMRRVVEIVGAGSVVQLGVRAGTRDEWELARALAHSGPTLDVPPRVWADLSRRPVYVSVDIDAVDPADAPGTGNPEPEGIPARDLLRFVRRLGGLAVVGLDLVEVSPAYDPSGRTAVLAATVLREAILALRGPAGLQVR